MLPLSRDGVIDITEINCLGCPNKLTRMLFFRLLFTCKINFAIALNVIFAVYYFNKYKNGDFINHRNKIYLKYACNFKSIQQKGNRLEW